MTEKVPSHYHTLEPFIEFFRTGGLPILTYHKIGPRPARVRRKGLYVSPKRFVKQLAELDQAGFVSCALDEVDSPSRDNSQRIAITFDDGFRNSFENSLEPLARHKFRATHFLVPNFIGKLNEWDLRDGEAPEPLMDAAQVRDWLSAGHQIGSHSFSHPRLTRLSLRDAREEIFASKKALEDSFGVQIDHFCYPYGDWNPAVRDIVIEAGYCSACASSFGLNVPGMQPHSLNRIAVRYPTRSLKALKERFFN